MLKGLLSCPKLVIFQLFEDIQNLKKQNTKSRICVHSVSVSERAKDKQRENEDRGREGGTDKRLTQAHLLVQIYKKR